MDHYRRASRRPAIPTKTNRSIPRHGADDTISNLADAVISLVPDIQALHRVHRDAERRSAQSGARRRPIIAAETNRSVPRHRSNHALRDLPDAAHFRDVQVPGQVHGNARRPSQLATRRRPVIAVKPNVPFPATVVITPLEISRTRLKSEM